MSIILLPYTDHGDVFVTPDLARQIVALAADPTTDATPSDVRPYLLLPDANAAVIDDLKADLAACRAERDTALGYLDAERKRAFKREREQDTRVEGLEAERDKALADLAACREGIISILERERAAFRESEDKDARRALELDAVAAERDRLAAVVLATRKHIEKTLFFHTPSTEFLKSTIDPALAELEKNK